MPCIENYLVRLNRRVGIEAGADVAACKVLLRAGTANVLCAVAEKLVIVIWTHHFFNWRCRNWLCGYRHRRNFRLISVAIEASDDIVTRESFLVTVSTDVFSAVAQKFRRVFGRRPRRWRCDRRSQRRWSPALALHMIRMRVIASDDGVERRKFFAAFATDEFPTVPQIFMLLIAPHCCLRFFNFFDDSSCTASTRIARSHHGNGDRINAAGRGLDRRFFHDFFFCRTATCRGATLGVLASVMHTFTKVTTEAFAARLGCDGARRIKVSLKAARQAALRRRFVTV